MRGNDLELFKEKQNGQEVQKKMLVILVMSK